MRLVVRKSGEVIVGMSELEAVTFCEVMNTVKGASDEQPDFFGRTQKAIIRDMYKTMQGLDKAVEKANAEPESADSAESEGVDEVISDGVKATV